jgi:hypothetical protein
MSENFPFYAGLGFVETGRVREAGYDRVYFEKRLDPAEARPSGGSA